MVMRNITGGAQQRPPFGRHHHILIALASGFQPGGQRGFGNAPAVKLGGVEPVDPAVQGGAHRGVLFFLGDFRESKAHQPAAARKFHHPQPDGRDFYAGFSKAAQGSGSGFCHDLILTSDDFFKRSWVFFRNWLSSFWI